MTTAADFRSRLVALGNWITDDAGRIAFDRLLTEFDALGLSNGSCGWQTIETAPKDGTPILAGNTRLPGMPPVVVRFFSGNDEPAEGCWGDAATPSGDAMFFNARYFDVWQPAPLPTPPAPDGQNG